MTEHSDKENTNHGNIRSISSPNSSKMSSAHKNLLLETLFLLQQQENYHNSSAPASTTLRQDTLSLHQVQQLITSILENNVHGVHSIVAGPLKDAVASKSDLDKSEEINEESDDEGDIIKSLKDSHISHPRHDKNLLHQSDIREAEENKTCINSSLQSDGHVGIDLDEDGEEQDEEDGERSWISSEQEHTDKLLGPLNHKSGGTTGVVLELDGEDRTATPDTSTTGASPFPRERARPALRLGSLIQCVSSSTADPDVSAHLMSQTSETVATYASTEGEGEDDSSYDASSRYSSSSSSSNSMSNIGRPYLRIKQEEVDEAVDVSSLPRQGYTMMKFLCHHLLQNDQDEDRRPPPPPPSPCSSSTKSLSLQFPHLQLPEYEKFRAEHGNSWHMRKTCRGRESDGNIDTGGSDDELGYTKWRFTSDEIEVIEQEYEWYVHFYSTNGIDEDENPGEQCSDEESHQSEKLSASLYTNMVSTGDCNLSDDLEEDLFSAEACLLQSQHPSVGDGNEVTNPMSSLEHWIEGVDDEDISEAEQGIEFYRLGVSHGDIFLDHEDDGDENSDDNDEEYRNFAHNSAERIEGVSGDKLYDKPLNSSRADEELELDDSEEVYVEFQLPIVYQPYKTGLEPSPNLVLREGDIVAGRYHVCYELGSAAFSIAYRCIDLKHEGVGNSNVCLKVIQNSKDFLDQSLDEIKVLQVLQNGRDGKFTTLLSSTITCDTHHILHLRRYFYYKEHLILVTELLEDNLYEFDCKLRRQLNAPRYFTMQRLSYITRQMLLALQYVHSLGLIHCDVKPENIVMWSHEAAKVKLIDFGSACFTTDHLSSYVQSRSYRAPEVVLGLPYNEKVDLWSLGCVVAELFTGQVLFQNESVIGMLARIEAICGAFPKDMISKGRKSHEFYLSSGLLCEENVMEEDGARSKFYDVYRPKRTTLAERLGLEDSNNEVEALFVDFVGRLLTLEPEERPSSKEALDHPWIEWGMTLTEENVRYLHS